MNENNRSKILETVRRVMEMENSPNEHEAAVAAAKALELLAKYNLTREEILAVESGRTDNIVEIEIPYINVSRRQVWMTYLAQAIAESMYCRILLSSWNQKYTKPVMWIIGHEHNAKIVEYLYFVLGNRLIELAYRRTGEYVEEFKEHFGYSPRNLSGGDHPKSWRMSWIKGAVTGIRLQLQTKRQQMYNEEARHLQITVRYEDEVSTWLEETYPKMKTQKSQSEISNAQAFWAGKRDGEAIEVDPALEEV